MKKSIQTEQAPQAIGAYSQAIQVGETVYLSGQIPLDPVSMTLVSGTFEQQVIRTLQNLQAVAKAAGGDLDRIVKLTIYLTDLSHFAVLNQVMTQFFMEPYPARATVQVSALPKNAQVEVDAVMVL
jgi:reactive intermediate/imine deaminase